MRVGIIGTALLAVVVSGCERDDPCRETASCPVDMRCEIPTGENVGICIDCAAEEIPYDGVDNDCLARTRDRDIDQDGDNWIDAPIAPGTDCNDSDPSTYGGAPERCGDERDNDCDGEVDESQCIGQSPPTVRLSSPIDGSVVFGRIVVALIATDDFGVERVELVGPRGVQLAQTDRAPYTFEFDTRTLDDGLIPIVARATDVAGLTSVIQFEYIVDNGTGPVVRVVRGPSDGSRYGGNVGVELVAADESEVARIDVMVDTILVASSTTSTLTASFDARSFSDGNYDLTIVGVDGRGSISRDLRSIVVDNTPPTVTMTGLVDGSSVAVGVHTIQISAADPAGILRVWFEGQSEADETLTATVAVRPGLQTVTASAADIVNVDDQLIGNVGWTTINVTGVSSN